MVIRPEWWRLISKEKRRERRENTCLAGATLTMIFPPDIFLGKEAGKLERTFVKKGIYREKI